ncbi:preprotein translocase subunit SecE [Pseudobacteriovorax antillogorgiicola]|uniref:Protein translocase subunit SecE n=1 Tax=Pseudobacteriovorax antillogorgiicola TaxID=1513793 RepID=A0A1Y6B760_9BACT|nr:preprotein translocase subunit SecE [Pseudobacteriovorax antillogorgiicola]TCS59485.1 preprotein translocase subunit SecE [Pseudobacteriovorax antillogorgiicola]SME87979.1 preprotein translocase subunit SecE [Pseudobacteriovorax antillogorgiicola]
MKKDDAFYLRLAYVIFAGLVAFTSYKALETIGVQTGFSEKFDELFQPASLIVALLIGAGTSLFLSRDKERHEYFLASVGELRKVTWPSFPDTRRMTIVVCVVVGIFAAILAAFDLIWAELLGIILT